MTNIYRAVSDRGLALYGEDAFEAEFSVTEEADALASGHLEIVPRKYKVLSNNYDAGKQGATVEAALLVELEAALIAGGHLERVDKPDTTTTTRKKG